MLTDFQPYVGPRPYERDDQNRFFGRDNEVHELLSLIVSSREVLFYAQSGTGKTSLLNAGVIPLLEQKPFEVLPVARVQGVPPPGLEVSEIQNVYIFNALMHWLKDEVDSKKLTHMSLVEFLRQRKRSADKFGKPYPRAIIFDQFEELFVLYADRWKDRKGFFEQVCEALEDDRRLRVVFAMREEDIAQLDPFSSLMPENLETRFRLEYFRQETALEAIEKPLRLTRCSFAPGVAEKLVEDLQKTKVETLKGETIEIIGQFVEPVQLQVVCQNLWNELPPDVMVITEEYRAKNVDIDRPLAKFYENAISEAVKQTGIPENILRDWCVKWLITSTGTRGIVHRGQKETDGIPNRALEILEDMHLLRSVWRAGAHWYELTHDRFIDPIRTSNESWRGEKADQALILIREAEQDINFQKYQRALDASRSAYLISEEVGDLQSEAIALLYHGKAYEGLKQNGEALTSYTKALGIVKQTKAREVETYVLLSQGSLFMQMNDYEKALQCYTNYITLLPNDSVGYYNLGLTYFNLGENERAIDHYTHALVLDPGDVDAYNNRGRTYYKLGDYERAIKDYERALELDPKYVYAYNNRGLIYSNRKDYERAIEDYNRAIELDSTYVNSYNNRGLAYSDLGENERAIEDYTHALELDPKYVNAYYNRGIVYSNRKDYERAIEDYTHALELDPKYINAYYNRGNRYSDLGDYERAIEDYTHALELDPMYVDAYNNRGLTYSDLRDYERAIEDYTHAIELDPTYVNAYYNRGIAYSDLGEHERAIEDYTRALELDPKYINAYYNRGNRYSDLGEHERAIEDYTHVVELDPMYVDAYNNRGNRYSDLGEHERAIEDYTRALELDPQYINAYYNRGLAYSDLGEHERAIEDYTQAIELDPNYVNAYYNRGNVYSNRKDYERAIEDYTQAIELDPKYVDAYYNRGNRYSDLKEYERAIEDYTRAIELDPTYVDAYNNRGLAYSDLKEYERAIEDYTRALELDSKYINAYYNRGLAYADLKEYERAIEDCNHALELDPTYVNAHIIRGATYSSLKQHEQAMHDFEHTIELDPENADAYLGRGYTYLWLRDMKQAQKDFMRSWQIDPTNVNYGWMTEWINMCQVKPGLETAERLEAITANHSINIVAYTYICQGVALWIQENFEKAEAELNQASQLNPESEDVLFWKGMVLVYMGQDDDARAAIEKSLELNLPPILLSPLRWTEQDRPDFYQKYAAPLLARYEIVNINVD